MLEEKIRDRFGNCYVVQLPHHRRLHKIKHVHLEFTSPDQAYRFISGLDAPYNCWRRLVSFLSTVTDTPSILEYDQNFAYSPEDQPVRLASECICRNKLFIYELAEHNNRHTPIKARIFEPSGGTKYIFSHPSILLASSTIEPYSIPDKTAAEALMQRLIGEDKADAQGKTSALAISLKLVTPAASKPLSSAQTRKITAGKPANDILDANQALIIAALLAGDIVIIEQKPQSAPPKPQEEMPLTAADRPIVPSSASFAPPSVMAEPDNELNQASQAATLIKAAEEGTPFCGACEKAEQAQAIAPALADATSNVTPIVAAAPVIANKISDNIPGPVTPKEEPKFFTELEFLYDDSSVIEEGVPYVATFSDGTQQEGTLDSKGFARIDGIPEGKVDVVFGDPEAEKQLDAARNELDGFLTGIVDETKVRGEKLDAELDKLSALDQGMVLTDAFFTGLYDEAVDIVDAAKMIAETGVEIFADIDEARREAYNIIATGNIDAAKEKLEELVSYGEEALDSVQETYNTLQLLYTDEPIKTMLTDFPGNYFSAMPAVEKAGAASGLALTLLFALVSGGAGAAASAASKAPKFMKAADKVQDIIVLLKKTKINKKQSQSNNKKIAAVTAKPKKDKLEEKEKKKFKCDWKNCEGGHKTNINKKYSRNGSINKGKSTSGEEYENEWVSVGLEPWVKNGGYGADPMMTREDYEAEFPKGVKPRTAGLIDKAMKSPKKYVTQKHHIISVGLFKNFSNLSNNAELIGWNVNDKTNGICLPYFTGDIVRHDLQCHRGQHPALYNKNLSAMLRKLEKKCLKYCNNNQRELVSKLDMYSKRVEGHILNWTEGWFIRASAEKERALSYDILDKKRAK